jgi:RNA polymerase sigma-70 factor (ECF subfamily)
MERKEAGSLVRQAVEKLPEKFKTPLVLRDIQELTYEEISEILDLPEGTVKSRINRGRMRVKEILRPYYGGEDSGGVAQ